mmetsp:Transcript_64434/g.149857  ORF Transcript_64434/g.149857 Transcript_64434/m.149857 type:complete len:226 (-) Transcript_64434:63-740(-)
MRTKVGSSMPAVQRAASIMDMLLQTFVLMASLLPIAAFSPPPCYGVPRAPQLPLAGAGLSNSIRPQGGAPGANMSGIATMASLSLGAVLLARCCRAYQQRAAARTALSAIDRQKMMKGETAILCIRKTFNNTHVALTKDKGQMIWCTTEKRYGKTLPNTNYAVEAAVYTAEKLGIQRVIVQLKGPNAAGLQGAIAAVRNTGIDVAACIIHNNIAYGGPRAPGVRR